MYIYTYKNIYIYTHTAALSRPGAAATPPRPTRVLEARRTVRPEPLRTSHSHPRRRQVPLNPDNDTLPPACFRTHQPRFSGKVVFQGKTYLKAYPGAGGASHGPAGASTHPALSPETSPGTDATGTRLEPLVILLVDVTV